MAIAISGTFGTLENRTLPTPTLGMRRISKRFSADIGSLVKGCRAQGRYGTRLNLPSWLTEDEKTHCKAQWLLGVMDSKNVN